MFLHAFVECINLVVSRSHCGDSADYAFCENVEGWPVARPLVSFFPENQDWQLHLSFLSLPVLTPPPLPLPMLQINFESIFGDPNMGNNCTMTVNC
jgi:hypothetical protein